jgi:putative flippase GtrA/LmbE family N-acetylglucosaminyl deacetylase
MLLIITLPEVSRSLMPKRLLLRYVIVGATAYVIEIASLWVLRRVLELSDLRSVAISFWIGFVVAFGLQKLVTFRDYRATKNTVTKQIGAYSLLAAWNYGFTLLSVELLSGVLSVFVVRTLAVTMITSWNFIIYQWVFKPGSKPPRLRVVQFSRTSLEKAAKTQTSSAKQPTQVSVTRTNSKLMNYYGLIATGVLLATTVLWAYLGARLQQSNADQLVNSYLFADWRTFQAAIFPTAHSFLLKWPLFLTIKLLGMSAAAFVTVTVLLCVGTVGALAYIVRRIDRRPAVWGSLLLVLALSLLLVPSTPYAGALLPVNMAMIATRNLEYVLYIAGLVLVARSTSLKDRRWLLAVGCFGLLIASDKLFLSLGLGGSVLALAFYALRRQGLQLQLAFRWLLATGTAAILGLALLLIAEHLGLIHLSGGSAGAPYGIVHSLKDGWLGVVYAALGLLTNLGANPVFDVTVIRQLPHVLVRRFTVQLLPYVASLAVSCFGIYALVRVVWMRKQVKAKSKRPLQPDTPQLLSGQLLFSSLAALGAFIVTNHYYAVDARYLTISLFAVFVGLATYTRDRPLPRPRQIAGFAALMAGLLVIGVTVTLGTYHAGQRALASIEQRNQLVAQALQTHPTETLVGDYWRVLPLKDRSKSQQVAPLSACQQYRDTLASSNWLPDGPNEPFAYLATFDNGATDYRGCSLQRLLATFGRPSDSTLIAGTYANPTELLLFYDEGQHPDATIMDSPAVLPVGLDRLLHTGCTPGTKTIMNIVAHEDDDLLFLSPDLLRSIQAGECVRTVYVTAGDSGQDGLYWQSRERGSQAAYSAMIGTSTTWVSQIVRLADGQFVSVSHPLGNTKISLVFLRLPDGNMQGAGFERSRHESLERLEAGYQPVMHAADGQSIYTAQQLTHTLQVLMETYGPQEIRTQAPEETATAFPDHSDHRAVGRFVGQAFQAYEAQNSVSLSFYMGYPVRERELNLPPEDIKQKAWVFSVYAGFDDSVCQSMVLCEQELTYGSYLGRQYLGQP